MMSPALSDSLISPHAEPNIQVLNRLWAYTKHESVLLAYHTAVLCIREGALPGKTNLCVCAGQRV